MMTEKSNPSKSRKSLRNLLTFWFLFFSVIPLIFITGYSLSQFQYAIDEELFKRLNGNSREVEVVFDDLEGYLVRYGRIHATDPSLIYSMSTMSIPSARRLISGWMTNYAASRVSLFDREGKLRIALFKDSSGEIKSQTNLEAGDVFLAESLLKEMDGKSQVRYRDVRKNYGMELIVYSKVTSKKGRVIGYLEEIINIDRIYLDGLKKRMNLEFVLFDKEFTPVVATLDDFKTHPSKYFKNKISDSPRNFFEVAGNKQAYGFFVGPVDVTKKRIFLGIAASKEEVQKALGGIQNALITVVAVIILLVVLTLFAATNMIVRPIYDLVEAAKQIEAGRFGTQIPVTNDNEVGYLTETFNKMSVRIAEAISELEEANSELQETQAQLVHSAKMVSLGQLVAGVAHELNNPIGFIYSNMSHLKEYSEKLSNLADLAESEPQKVSSYKKEIEYEYIVDDLPKLIKSCEDGARRVRDIVLGLRNFSRMEGKGLEVYDLKENIEATLSLLSGELKTRIKVHTEFASDNKVKCFGSQINQVLTNILSNAAQSIDSEGDIWITTKKSKKSLEIEIRDSGRGIPKGEVDKIFDPFFTTKDVGEGTGLGLSISYGIIQKHEGDIKVTSLEGKGTTFTVVLPVLGPKSVVES